jgi:hypothetical protein
MGFFFLLLNKYLRVEREEGERGTTKKARGGVTVTGD